jgi:hypothetical protein
MDRFFTPFTPFWDEVTEKNDPSKEHIQEQDFKAEERLSQLKRSL